jgi:pilus assembly protein Flp/PilA
MIAPAKQILSRFLREDDGATAIEYGLIVGLMFLAIVTAVKNVATQNTTLYTTIDTTLATATSG